MRIPTSKNFKDITGMRFGRLVVIEYQGNGRPDVPKRPYHLWLCQCDCGETTIVAGSNLRRKTTTSCGCYHKEATSKARLINITGKRYGMLVVLGRNQKTIDGQPYWSCQCDCGEKSIVDGPSLKTGRSKSCGCRQGNYVHGLSGTKEYKKYLYSFPEKKLRHYVSVAVRKAFSKTKSVKDCSTFEKLPYTAQELKKHLESLWEEWMNWDNYGGKNNDPRKTWHIDHIIPQSKFVYISMDDPSFQECWSLSNLRPLEKIANLKKSKK